MSIIPLLSLALVVSTALSASGAAQVVDMDSEQTGKIMAAVQNNGSHLSLDNQVKRLQQRIEKRFGVAASAYNVKLALIERRTLLGHRINVGFSGLTGMHAAPSWTASLAEHPEWMVFDSNKVSFGIDQAFVLASFDAEYPAGMERATHAEVTGTYDDNGILRATVVGTPKDGYVIDTVLAAKTIANAFAKQEQSVVIPVEFQKGTVVKDGVPLTLLATGKSEFASSPAGRKHNVRKAMNERLNGAIAPQGQEFSFNKTLGGPVTYSRGWVDSLIIVNGNQLEPAAGGGICQAATTLYRSIVLAGLQVGKRKPHSLYVTYYKKFGLGIDATIYPGKQDLTFTNDTPGDIVILAHTNDKHEGFVSLYGVDDGRTVAMDGPYLGATAPEWMQVNGRPVSSREVVWNQTITRADGTVTNNLIVSNYSKMPAASLAKEFPAPVGLANFYDPVEVPVATVAGNL